MIERYTDLADRLVAELARRGPLPALALARSLGQRGATVVDALQRLWQAGRVERDQAGTYRVVAGELPSEESHDDH